MLELVVCVGTSCHLRGAEKVIKLFQKHIKEEDLDNEINLQGTFCMGKCSGEHVMVSINGKTYETSPESAEKLFIEEVLPAIKEFSTAVK